MTLSLPANDSLGDHSLALNGHSGLVFSVAFSPSGQILASGSIDETIRLWDVESGAQLATLSGHSEPVGSVTFSPDGTVLASGSWDTTIKLWDVRSRAQIATLKGHSGDVLSLAFSPDGKHLASGSRDDTIRLWAMKSRVSTNKLEGDSSWVRSVAFSPDGKRIASGYENSTIKIWNVASGTSIATLNGHSAYVNSVSFSPSGEYLASGSADNTIRLWDPVTGAHLSTMEGHSDIVFSVAFSPNNKYLASGSFDHTIRLWDVASRSYISTLKGHSNNVYSVVFSPDGTRLASGSQDRTIRIWRISREHEMGPEAAAVGPQMVETTETMGRASDEYDTALPSTSFPLNNDITSSISLAHSDRIGLGGFGDLYLGNHKDRGKVALKRPHRLFDEALIRRFLREVDLWCSISHPHVLACLGMCKIGPDVYVVSPFIENGDLLSCMRRGKVLNRTKLLYEVAEALAHLHHKGIVHGDVKAQNILLSDDGSALLCDFGLAKAFDSMVTSTESKGVGSVRWMAPELFLGESRSMASDVYSLGITIAEVLSGQAPYQNLSENLAVMLHVAYHDGRPTMEPMVSPEGKSYATLWETAEKCWVKEVKVRPYMAQVLAMLFPLTRELA